MWAGALVKLNTDVCFTSAAGGRRLKPISSSTLDKQGIVCFRATADRTVLLKKDQPYLVVSTGHGSSGFCVVLDTETMLEVAIEEGRLQII